MDISSHADGEQRLHPLSALGDNSVSTPLVPLLNRDQIDRLPERAREVVEYRKGGCVTHAGQIKYTELTGNGVREVRHGGR